jgi:hypothetical protein
MDGPYHALIFHFSFFIFHFFLYLSPFKKLSFHKILHITSSFNSSFGIYLPIKAIVN